MRPSLLDPLFAPAASLPGIGPKLAPLIDRLLGEPMRPARVVDLLFHLPHGGISRELQGSISDAPLGEPTTVAATVMEHHPPSPGRSRTPYRVRIEDETGDVTLIFFNGQKQRLEKLLPPGSKRYVSGILELWEGRRQMVHPDRVLDAVGLASLPAMEPVYGQTEGLSSRLIARFAGAALTKIPDLPEWQDSEWLKRQEFPTFREALNRLHQPKDETALDPKDPARRRLAYDELLASQMALALVRSKLKRMPGRINGGDGSLLRRIEASLPFGLTKAQQRSLQEIRADLQSEHRMLRLLQGDVGSGKTILALLAMASAVEAGRQAALMAPTEILARQHHQRLQPIAQKAGLTLAILTGREKGQDREMVLAGLADGTIDMIVGTHALFQDTIAFRDLGLAVIDEQHRFGVHQRLALSSKGDGVDILVMTATPIPRTLALAHFGDMDISILDEKPAGRQPIVTRIVSIDRLDETIGAIARAVAAGAQVYWVCPLVAESENLDLAAAEDRFVQLRDMFGDIIGIVHGRLSGREKDDAMARFLHGETKILVATTVIEVGVDVAAASIMVIEHAERFGLAQLHQLRGRIGRGPAASTCLLLYKGPLGANAKARLEIMRETEDGFRIAEEDLRLRGEGEIMGARQSGLPEFKLACLDQDGDLIKAAQDDARLVVMKDSGLADARGKAIRILLYLFEREAGVKRLRSG